jgi:SSS family solute:Na+ symporter
MVVAAVWAPQIARFPTLWQYAQSLLAYVTPPIVVVFLFGVCWKRANAAAALTTMVTTIPLGAMWWIINDLKGLTSIQFLYGCGLMFMLSALVFLSVTAVTKPPDPRMVEQHVWRPSIWREESAELAGKPWYVNYRILSVALLFVTTAVVIWWA